MMYGLTAFLAVLMNYVAADESPRLLKQAEQAYRELVESGVIDRDAQLRKSNPSPVNLRQMRETTRRLCEINLGMGCGATKVALSSDGDLWDTVGSLGISLHAIQSAADHEFKIVVEDQSLLTLPVRRVDLSPRPLAELLNALLQPHNCEFVILPSGDVLVRRLPLKAEDLSETRNPSRAVLVEEGGSPDSESK